MARTSMWVTITCVGVLLNGPAYAGCAQPNVLSVQPATAAPGAHVTVRGELLSEAPATTTAVAIGIGNGGRRA